MTVGQGSGGPAFPAAGVDGSYDGMSLRDFYAGLAMVGLIASGYTQGNLAAQTLEDRAFSQADVMLKAGERW